MHIKKLEISGFKSFVDRTVIHFDHDVIGIVGPNGCGKSNIVDALRWCMGEQSAKHLRGRSMEDVIFSGSESRPAHGMAEVILTFDNTDAGYAATLPEGFIALANAIQKFDFTSALPALKVPCLVVYGEDDEATPPVQNQKLAKLIPGAQAVAIPGGRHLPNVDRHEDFNRILVDWVNRQRHQ